MSISISRVKEVMAYLVDHGEVETILKYNLKPETLARYKRHDRFKETKIPKVLLLDVETAPALAYVWRTGKQWVSHEDIVKPSFMLSWSAKWLFSPDIYSEIVKPKEAVGCTSKKIINGLWRLIEGSDVVIGHNLRAFDIKWFNAQCFLNGLKPPLPYQTIDTLVESRKLFYLPSHKLEYLSILIKNKEKIRTDKKLWIECVEGKKDSLDYMLKYNKKDVLLLEEVYLEMRPWIKSHPNLGLYMEAKEPVCPNCGSFDLQWGGEYITMVGAYASFRCKECGAIGRCRTTSLSKKQRKKLTVSIAR